MAEQAKKSNRKVGRNAKWCDAYRNRSQREINRGVKLLRTLKRKPCPSAQKAWDGLSPLTQQHAKRRYASLCKRSRR